MQCASCPHLGRHPILHRLGHPARPPPSGFAAPQASLRRLRRDGVLSARQAASVSFAPDSGAWPLWAPKRQDGHRAGGARRCDNLFLKFRICDSLHFSCSDIPRFRRRSPINIPHSHSGRINPNPQKRDFQIFRLQASDIPDSAKNSFGKPWKSKFSLTENKGFFRPAFGRRSVAGAFCKVFENFCRTAPPASWPSPRLRDNIPLRAHPAFPNVNPSFTVNGLVRRGAARDQQVLMSV